MVRMRVIYSGRVQGVGFRATAAWVAEGRAVTGWVRNEPDGTVMLEVQGSASEVEGYLAAVRERIRGIAGETVAGVEVVEGEREFEVRR